MPRVTADTVAAARAGISRVVVLALHLPTRSIFLGERSVHASWTRDVLASTFNGYARDRGAADIQFHDGLISQDAITLDMDRRAGVSAGIPSFTFTVDLEGLDVGAEFYPEAGTCEVAAIIPGQPWEDRWSLLEGGREIAVEAE